jgi:signal transduction histidine kinase
VQAPPTAQLISPKSDQVPKRGADPHLDDGIEPGILPVFRLFTVVAWLILSPTLLSLLAPQTPEKLPNYLAIFCWGQFSLLGVYLSWPGLRRHLRQFYLPIALGISAIGPVVFQILAAKMRLAHGVPTVEALQPNPGSLYLWLMLPLLLGAMQYGYRALLGLTVGTSGLSVFLVNLLTPPHGPIANTVTEQAITRLLVFTLAGAIIVRLSRVQRQQRQQLVQKNLQLTHYATTLEQLAISRERNRIARELHDTLAHTLSAISVQLQALDVLWDDPAAARQTLQQTQALTRQGLQEARRTLHGLRASRLQELGLASALKQLLEQLTEQTPLQVTFEISAALDGLPAEVEQQIYRITEEALTNVVQHAAAKTVEIAIHQNHAQLCVQIADDGIGFDPATVPVSGHYGLLGMQERANLISGNLTILSQPEQGTIIQLDLPINLPIQCSTART